MIAALRALEKRPRPMSATRPRSRVCRFRTPTVNFVTLDVDVSCCTRNILRADGTRLQRGAGTGETAALVYGWDATSGRDERRPLRTGGGTCLLDDKVRGKNG